MNLTVRPRFISSGVVTIDFALAKTMYADSVFFVMSNGRTPPPGGYLNGTRPPGPQRCMVQTPIAQQWGTFRAPLTLNGTGEFDLDSFCTRSVCPGSLVRDCGFTSGFTSAPAAARAAALPPLPARAGSAGRRMLLAYPEALSYSGKMEVWLAGDKLLCVFWGNVSLLLPLSATAAGADGLPVRVNVNEQEANVNTIVTGYGLLPSTLSFGPGQGAASGLADGTAGVTDVFVGEVYVLRHSVPLLPDGLVVTGQRVVLDTEIGPLELQAVPGTTVFNATGKYVDFAFQARLGRCQRYPHAPPHTEEPSRPAVQAASAAR